MREGRAPGEERHGSRWRRVQRASTSLLRGLYTTTALLGLLFTPPLLSLALGPVLAAMAVVLLGSFIWYLQGHWPARRTLTTTAAITVALLPFGHGVLALQGVGQVIVLLALVLLVVLAVGAFTASGSQRSGASPTHLPRGADVRLRELLQVLPLPTLLAEWRALRQLRPDTDAVVAAELRSLLLDELQHRDPIAFSRWLDTGAPGPPDEHFLRDQGPAP